MGSRERSDGDPAFLRRSSQDQRVAGTSDGEIQETVDQSSSESEILQEEEGRGGEGGGRGGEASD